MSIVYTIAGILVGLIVLRMIFRLIGSMVRASHNKKIDKQGQDFVLKVNETAYDPNFVNNDGAMAARLKCLWQHPDSGEEHELSSEWFWYIPKQSVSLDSIDEISVRIFTTDPERLNRFDLKAFDLQPVVE
ncbi:MAG: hypothetical protein EP297_14425 [Gammaproteobacteria bacterium]|nr:MAG: hypothetical protein EP297_14425 [Gammaproteobacteria bacterium]